MNKTLHTCILALSAFALLVAVGAAQATPKPPPKDPAPPAAAPSTSDAAALAAAAAAAAAKAKAGAAAGSESKAVTGPVSNASELTGEQVAKLRNQTSTDVDLGDTRVEGSTARSYSFGVDLPELANAGDIAAAGCPDPRTDKSARGIGWGLASTADASQDNSACTLRMLAAQASQDCQNEEARSYRLAAAEKAAGKPLFIGAAVATNLTLQECITERLRAAGKVTNAVTNNFTRIEVTMPPAPVVAEPPPPPAPPPACAKGFKRNSKGVCYKPQPPKPPCPEGEKLVCEKPKN